MGRPRSFFSSPRTTKRFNPTSSGYENSVRSFWYRDVQNMGDMLAPLILSRATRCNVIFTDEPTHNVICSIGSIINLSHPNWTIWGSGFGSVDDRCPNDLDIKCVRGPFTARKLKQHGYSDLKVLGDPGLLASRFIPSEARPIRGRIGLCLHYVDYTKSRLMQLMLSKASFLFGSEKLVLINPKSDPITFISELTKCERVISSALHPLILSDSYGIPNYWIRFPYGTQTYSTFKFRDYLESIDRKQVTPLDIDTTQSLKTAVRRTESWIPISWNGDALLDALPV